CTLFFSRYGHHRDLHSFPTRRSSDLLNIDEPATNATDSEQAKVEGVDSGTENGQAGDEERLETIVEEDHPKLSVSHNSTTEAKRSEEHTSELQSRENLVCRLLLEKKK